MARLKSKRIIDAINKGISINPTTFDVKYIEKVLVDGAYEKVENIITYTGIIYLEDNSNKITIESKTQGTSYTTNKYKMILNNENEIKIDEKNVVEFESKEGHLKVTGAYPIIIEDTLCGYLCDLERT
ncbi:MULTISPECIES: hypothetical protein [unclassified Clostridium]|uniref:hypothetical protein n=1 Tax=unclassified Clostridium TaxID=2614128 RepID=UPI0005FC18F7|nr:MULTISPECIES: hypothetical protein [unclassified Clostridium]KJZ83928.1 hypothetical protein ClosIBUN125C_CONTIG68g03819 [Clostridium sp. IBUN125C]KJZ85426.1 Phage-like element PBSX protein xkdK [Clostridium sp. IBUN13A]KJZ90009.1 hypothetical protein ClosIBUN22A_CONTIG200g04026 [Clostridium sp. IBUN22A]KJZ93409.1 hypothetical protein ClosIBUN62F_CONTIG43g01543 [Clostridium sp. IBUN62F]